MMYLIALPVALAASLILTPAVRALALRTSFVDVPDGRRFHSSTVPLLGGVAVVGSVVLAWAVAHAASRAAVTAPELLLALGLLASFVLGLYDDRKGMSAKLKLGLQGVCAVLLVWGCYAGGWTRGGLFFPLAVVWAVAVMNATNFLDNMDGIAGGVAAAGALAFMLILYAGQQWVGAMIAASLLGASVGFLRYNFSPASIFMGDAGSLPVGYLLAGLSILAAGEADFQSVAAPVVVLGYPVFDLTFVTLVRMKERRPIYHGGKDHTTHRLAARLVSTRKTALFVYVVCLALGASGILMRRAGEPLVSLAFVAALSALLAALGLRLYRTTSPRLGS